MTRQFKTAWVLLTTATVLAFALTGFTLITYEELVEEAPMSIACGTSYINAPSPVKMDERALAGELVFKANCKACHAIERTLIGPPMKDVYSRVPNEAWLRSWITNSSKLIASGDPYAVELFRENKGTQMTNFTTMKKEDLDVLLAYLKHVSAQ